MKKWKLISSKMAFDHKWFKVRQDTVELPNGKIMDDYFVWEGGDAVMIVPVTEDGKFITVSQYKHGAGEIMMEFPAGFIDKGEDAKESAIRELVEETGYVPKKIATMGYSFYNPTKATGKIYYFLATGCQLEKEIHLDEAEDIELSLMNKNELVDLINKGEIKDNNTITSFFKAEKILG